MTSRSSSIVELLTRYEVTERLPRGIRQVLRGHSGVIEVYDDLEKKLPERVERVRWQTTLQRFLDLLFSYGALYPVS